ncbi:MAG: SCP2 sterol-binding domain-containing protein [Lachnospiraceae bacterium]|nr:SCP2 sterol-binding domain-containing protein [Lachnospiraceae bacterium]
MKINIYYGGRGLIGDPTLVAVKIMMNVFEELNVKVERYDLFEQKNNITTLPRTLKEADGVILASTVEWHGVGGMMMSFLDACWLYGDKEKISHLYMAPVVMSTTYGEKEAELDLMNAWQSLGGTVCPGISGYMPEVSELEGNETYKKLIEKAAENIYRSVNQHTTALPVSVMAVRKATYKTRNTTLTQQETEQLSEYASDDHYVAKQKEDIKELTDLFKGKMLSHKGVNEDNLPRLFKAAFKPDPSVNLKYKVNIKGKDKAFVMRIDGKDFEADYGELVYADIEMSMDKTVLMDIVEGRMSFQKGFMTGVITAKGDFAKIRLLDQLFIFRSPTQG